MSGKYSVCVDCDHRNKVGISLSRCASCVNGSNYSREKEGIEPTEPWPRPEKKIDNGGPAFPVGSPEMAIVGQSTKETQGMTLRDYFAGQALIMYSSKENRQSVKQASDEKMLDFTPDDIDELISKACYLMADAMIKEAKS